MELELNKEFKFDIIRQIKKLVWCIKCVKQWSGDKVNIIFKFKGNTWGSVIVKVLQWIYRSAK